MRLPLAIGGLALLAASPLAAADSTGMRFWNRTEAALSEAALTPAGTDDFGPNLCRTGPLAADAQVPVRGVPPGRYDLRLKDSRGRTCLVRDIAVQNRTTFSVSETDLVECKP